MKKAKKDIRKFTQASIGLGVGAGVVAGVGSKAGISVGAGLSTTGRFMPIVGTAMMGKHTLRLAGNLKPKRKKRRK